MTKGTHAVPVSNHDETMAGLLDSNVIARNRRVRNALERVPSWYQCALLAEHGPRQPGSDVPADWFPDEWVRRLAPLTTFVRDEVEVLAVSHVVYGCGKMGRQEALHYVLGRLREVDDKKEGRESRKAFVASVTASARSLRSDAAMAYVKARFAR